jgi:predicted small lipoprotein YifL
MKTLFSLLSAMLLLSATASAEAKKEPLPLPATAAESDGFETDSVPEPRSILFVGIGGLVLLAFATRRK